MRIWTAEKSLAYSSKALCSIEFTIRCAVACAVLHNLCIRLGDEWDDDSDQDDPSPPNPAVNVLRDGDDIREKLKNFIA